jgi:acetyltransferase-like isoleucine patch superfamily enzyme
VFIAPEFVGANDPNILHGRRSVEKFMPKAPRIKFGSRIAVNVTLLPGVVIGRECLVGASALVTKDLPDFSVAVGVPAKVVKTVEDKWRLPEELYQEFRRRVSEEDLQRFLDKVLRDFK